MQRPTKVDAVMILLTVSLGLVMAFRVVPAPEVSDAYADWLFASAVVDGIDPYQTINELGNRFGMVYQLNVTHPRPPGAAVLMGPLGFLTAEHVRDLNNALNVFSVVLILWISGGRFALPVGAFILSQPALYQWANHIPVVVALITISLLTGSDRLGGSLLGIAAAIKLWPIAVAAGLWQLGERRRAWVTMVVFLGLTAIGLLSIDSSIWRSVDAMGETSRFFVYSVSNGSPTSALVRLGVPFVVATVASLIFGTAWWLRHRTVEASLVLAFIISPLVWSGYHLVMAPFVATRVRSNEIIAIVVLGIFLLQGYSGWWRLLLTGLMVLAIEILPHRTRGLRSIQTQNTPSGARDVHPDV